MEREKFCSTLNLIKEDNIEEFKKMVEDEDFYTVSLLYNYANLVFSPKIFTWLTLQEPGLKNNLIGKSNSNGFKKMLDLVKSDNAETLKVKIDTLDWYQASLLLCYASESNAVETVKLLLKQENIMPQLANNYALRIADFKGHKEIKNLLLLDKRVDYKALKDDSLKIESKDIKSIRNNAIKSNEDKFKEYFKYIKEKTDKDLEVPVDISASEESEDITFISDLLEDNIDPAVDTDIPEDSIDTLDDYEETITDEDIPVQTEDTINTVNSDYSRNCMADAEAMRKSAEDMRNICNLINKSNA